MPTPELEADVDAARVYPHGFANWLKYWRFKNRESGATLTFRNPWPGQEKFRDLMIDVAQSAVDKGMWEGIFALKAGKLGFTELECAWDGYVLWARRNARVHLFSKEETAAKDMLGYVKFGLQHMEPAFGIVFVDVNEREVGASQAGTKAFKFTVVGPEGRDYGDTRSVIAYATSKNPAIDQSCLHGDSLVETPTGPRRIRHMVRDAYDGDVITVGPDGCLTARRVTGWYRSLIAGRRMFKLWLSSRPATKHQPAVNLTEDHLVMTPDGWIAAGELCDGDIVATGQAAPNEHQSRVLTGSMLGDGHARIEGRFSTSHVDHEYAGLLAKGLTGLGIKTKVIKAIPGHRSQTRVESLNRIWVAQLRTRWYGALGKFVDRSAVATMGDIGLAVWFMDDGWLQSRENGWRYSAGFATNGFTYEDVCWLSEWLQREGIENRPKRTRLVGQWQIYVSANGTAALMERIGRFVPPEMARKRTPLAPAFEAAAWDLGEPTVGFDQARIRPWTPPAHERTVYCIDVEETHNFVTPGGTLHNCTHAHVDEWAHMLDPRAAWGSISTTIAPAGTCHIVTRGAGEHQDVENTWSSAISNQSQLRGYFAPWTERPDRNREWLEAQAGSMPTVAALSHYAAETPEDAFRGDEDNDFVPIELWDRCAEMFCCAAGHFRDGTEDDAWRPDACEACREIEQTGRGFHSYLATHPVQPNGVEPLVVGVDAGVTRDNFAVVGVTRHPLRHDDPAIRLRRHWTPDDFEDGIIDFPTVEAWLRTVCEGGCTLGHPQYAPWKGGATCKRRKGQLWEPGECPACAAGQLVPPFNVYVVCYDPYQLIDMMQSLRRDGIFTYEFNQGKDRAEADRTLYDCIIGRRLGHTGDDAMRRHIGNAKGKTQKDEESKLRMVKKAPHRPIDLGVAASMAVARCLYYNL